MTLAIDFDGTIVTHAYPEIGREIPGAISTLRRLQDQGHRLILWSVREGQLLDDAIDFCRQRGLEFFAANENFSGEAAETDTPATGCRKLTADLYIDDRNLGGFPGWEAIYAMISRHQTYPAYFSSLQETAAPPRRSLLSRLLHN